MVAVGPKHPPNLTFPLGLALESHLLRHCVDKLSAGVV